MLKKAKISQRKKSLILSEAAKSDCVISSLAKSYNISKGTIYKWLKQRKQQASKVCAEVAVATAKNDFIELAVVDANKHYNSYLQKASFVFNDFSLSFEGKFKSEVVLKIINALDESTC